MAGRIRPHRRLPLSGAGRDPCAGKGISKGAARGCEQTQGQACNIPQAEARLQQNEHFGPTSPREMGGVSLCDTYASPRIPLNAQYKHRAEAKLKSNANCHRPPRSHPAGSPWGRGDIELQRLADMSSAPQSSSFN